MSKPIFCDQCGVCCELFLINLNESEYLSGKYRTVFENIENFKDYNEAQRCGANILKQKTDGSCFYLKENYCAIHHYRPVVCRNFFCNDNEPAFAEMKTQIHCSKQAKK